VYAADALSYALGRRLMRLPHIGMANILAGRRIMAELVQEELTPSALCEELERLLGDAQARAKALDELRSLRLQLGGPGAGDRAAEQVLDLMGAQPTGILAAG
jgi:lipid-A-disaccharide synthase